MNRTRIAIVGLALLATACTGGGGTTGTPTATPTDATSPTSSANAAGDGKLASVKPCELISSSEATQLGLPDSPKPGRSAGADSCEWNDANIGLLVAVETKQGAEGFNYKGDTKTQAKFGSYEGFTVAAPKGANGICHAVLAITDSSSVQIVANAGEDASETPKACDLATKSAERVATKLA